MCNVAAAALAFWIGLCLGSTVGDSDERPPTDAAICAQYEWIASIYQERINGVEKFCHTGVANAAD
jgi:hypothetical protein